MHADQFDQWQKCEMQTVLSERPSFRVFFCLAKQKLIRGIVEKSSSRSDNTSVVPSLIDYQMENIDAEIRGSSGFVKDKQKTSEKSIGLACSLEWRGRREPEWSVLTFQ